MKPALSFGEHQHIILGPFTATHPIGQGSMGAVWAGVHTLSGVPVALKVLPPNPDVALDFVEVFQREVQAVARLQHPNIIKVFDHGTVSIEAEYASGGLLCAGDLYLAMELATGGTLLDAEIPDWKTLRSILKMILSALGHAHARGVIHRDVKPGNVLRCLKEGRCAGFRLSDFGLAAALDQLKMEERGGVKGTPAFMAPEQCRGEWRDHGPWTDLYSVGCLAYMLASGAPPFPHTNPLKVLMQQLSQPPPPLVPQVQVPPGFEGWLGRLLEKSPRRRYRWAIDALRDLEQLGDVHGENETAPSPSVHLKTPTQLRPLLTSYTENPPECRQSAMKLVGVGLGLYGLRTLPLIGRRKERDRLWDTLLKVQQTQRAHLTVVGGEAGVGKSRLALEIVQHAHEEGIATTMRAVHQGSLSAPNSDVPHMIAAYLRTDGLDPQKVLQRVRETLGDMEGNNNYFAESIAELISTPTAEESSLDSRMIHFSGPNERHITARRTLKHLSKERPLLVWLDGVQQGCETIDFIEHVMSVQDRDPCAVFFLLTLRDDLLAEHPEKRTRLQRLASGKHGEMISLQPLSPKDHSELVKELLGLDGELSAQVISRTAGNPLFATQLVGDWVDRGVLEASDDGFRLRTGEQAPLPDDIHTLWVARIRRLLHTQPSSAARSLEIAATLGVEVNWDEWRAACAQFPAILFPEGLVASMVARGIAQSTEDGWSFSHEMFRESITRSAQEKGLLREHHQRCAVTIQNRPRLRQRAERVGYHLLEAGDLRGGAAFLLQGAKERYATSDYHTTLDLLDRRAEALELTTNPEIDEGCTLRCFALHKTGQLQRANILAKQAELYLRERAREGLRDILVVRGHLAKEQGLFKEAERCYREAIPLCRKAQDPFRECDALWGLGVVALSLSHFEDAQLFLNEARTLTQEIGYILRLADVHHQLGGIARKVGDLDAATRHVSSAMVAYGKRGSRQGLALCFNGLAELRRVRGDFVLAETLYRQALSTFEAIGSGTLVPRINLGLVLLQCQRFDEAKECFEDLVEELLKIDARALLGITYTAMLPCAAHEEDWHRFAELFKRAQKLLDETSVVDPDVAWPLQKASEMALQKGRKDLAKGPLSLAKSQWERMNKMDKVQEIEKLLRIL